MLQAIAFGGLVLFVLPAIAIEGSGGEWVSPRARPAWQLALLVQLLAIPAVLGLSAVQEVCDRGAGTPVPFDPPLRLVSSGVYAYVSNPMQLSAVLMLLGLGVALGNLWISAAGMMAHVCSVGLAAWDEEEDLQARFGPACHVSAPVRAGGFRDGRRGTAGALQPPRCISPRTASCAATCGPGSSAGHRTA